MQTNTYSNTNRNLSYLLIGGGIGATLALLFAPKSGSELREDISIAATNGLDKTRKTVNTLRENANTYYETAKDKANDYYETAKDKANEVYKTVSNKAEEVADDVKALPEKAEEIISEKVDQINSAVEAGEKEFKRKTKSASIY